MDLKRFSTVFPYGSHLCREPMPSMSEVKRDMEILRRSGFNMVKLQEHWQIDEPLEGQCDFSRIEELIEHAARLDMGVYVGLTCVQAPAWLWEKHNCHMVGRDGRPIMYVAQVALPGDGKPGPCFDHPGAMADQLRFIRRLVTALSRFPNIVVWNVWQEIGYWAEGIVGTDVCFCLHTLCFFQNWLRERYGDLDSLNHAWRTRYREWKHVLPNRSLQRDRCFPQDIHWHYFMANVQMARVLRERARAVRESDPLRRPVFAHKGAPAIASGQDWTYARTQDFLGSSCYPAWGPFQPWDDGHPSRGHRIPKHPALLAEMWDSVALRFDYIRCANEVGRPIWAAEFQGGPVSTSLHKGRIPSATDIRRWVFTALASGVSAISFWVTRAEIMAVEANGFSLLDSTGDTTERFEEAARIGRALQRYPDLFARPTRPAADVAIIVNEWNYWLCSLLPGGGEHLAYSTRGWHRLLWEAGIAVDFVELNAASEKQLQCYKALILPFPLSISETLAGKLARYVERGGSLVSEACPGRMDEHAYCRRGELSETLSELFGVRHEALALVCEPDSGARWTFTERTWGEFLDPAVLVGTGPLVGHELRAHFWLETFLCENAQPCLMYHDRVAGTVRRYGNGTAWLLGTVVGHGGTAYRDARSLEFPSRLLSLCNISPMHKGGILVHKRVTSGREAWILLNPTEKTLTETFDFSGWSTVEDILTGALPPGTIDISVPSMDARMLVLTR